jgi:crotonobetainyl-CoA:carnitine CoA-transferase CaiB-like acyl-CoA transferase/nucleotide-binding universal stress UspA family protein
VDRVRVLDASDGFGAVAVEVMRRLGATVERGELSRELLRHVDVAVVGRAARPWLACAREWPRLVWVAVTPFGLDGPRAAWAGSELVAQAAGGMVWPNGFPDAPPLPVPGQPATRAAGLHAALGALLALLARRRDGRGRVVDVSLQESAAALLEHVVGEWLDHGDLGRRRGSLHWNGTFRVGRCRDGEALLTHLGDWTALREWLIADGAARDLAAPRWDDVDERCRHAQHVFAVLDAWAATYDVATLVEQAQLRRLPFAPVWSLARFAREGGPGSAGIAARFTRRTESVRVAVDDSQPRVKRAWTPARHEDSYAPLHGLRVVDFTWVVAGPLTTRILADFGAEVIHVVRPDAPPPQGTSERNLQRGKRQLPLDLRRADDLARVRELLRRADVVIDNFSRRVLPNFGLDDDALHGLNPGLTIVHLTGFPADDARADWAAFGPTLQAMSGLVDAMRTPDGRAAGPGFAVADTATAWAAALAIAAALWRGGGARVGLSQREVLALMLAPLLDAGPARPADRPCRIVRCADADGAERWCAASPPHEGPPPELAARLAAARTEPAEAVVARLQAAGIAAAVVATPADLASPTRSCGGAAGGGPPPAWCATAWCRASAPCRARVDGARASRNAGDGGDVMSEPSMVIMCCTDFSPEADHAVMHGVRLAQATKGKLILAHLVHVASGELLSGDAHGPTNLTLSEARDRALQKLEDERQRLVGDYPDVDLVAKFGSPAESAIAIAKERNVDILVTAVTDKHTHRRATDLMHPSVTQMLTHQAPCPVLVVPPHAK